MSDNKLDTFLKKNYPAVPDAPIGELGKITGNMGKKRSIFQIFPRWSYATISLLLCLVGFIFVYNQNSRSVSLSLDDYFSDSYLVAYDEDDLELETIYLSYDNIPE